MNKNIIKELERLSSITTPQQRDIDLIFSLYKNFVDENTPFYTTGCNCQNSIQNIHKKLINWYKEWKSNQVEQKINELLNEEDDGDLSADDFFNDKI
jgi:hypothetical protein